MYEELKMLQKEANEVAAILHLKFPTVAYAEPEDIAKFEDTFDESLLADVKAGKIIVMLPPVINGDDSIIYVDKKIQKFSDKRVYVIQSVRLIWMAKNHPEFYEDQVFTTFDRIMFVVEYLEYIKRERTRRLTHPDCYTKYALNLALRQLHFTVNVFGNGYDQVEAWKKHVDDLLPERYAEPFSYAAYAYSETE